MKFLTGLILIAIGTSIIYYRFKIYDITGEWSWANTYLGNTMNVIIIFGMLFIGAGSAYPFGALDGLIGDNQVNHIEQTSSSK